MDTINKPQTELYVGLEGSDAKEVLGKVYGKELNSKKNILEYIELSRRLAKQESLTEQLIQDTYNLIFYSIDKLGGSVKVNTKYYLESQLKNELGKYVQEKDPRHASPFIEFFKEAYPPSKRKKDFTWVLTDINVIADEQIWTTLAYINSWCLKQENELNEAQRKDIIKMVERLVSKNNIKYINRVKSLEKLINILGIKIVSSKDGFKVKR